MHTRDGWRRRSVLSVVTAALALASVQFAAADYAAKVTITPTSGPKGTSGVNVSGSSFEPTAQNQKIEIYWDTETGTRLDDGKVSPTANGTFDAVITIPASATAGAHWVIACLVGGNAVCNHNPGPNGIHKIGRASFTVTAPSPSPTPSPTASQPPSSSPTPSRTASPRASASPIPRPSLSPGFTPRFDPSACGALFAEHQVTYDFESGSIPGSRFERVDHSFQPQARLAVDRPTVATHSGRFAGHIGGETSSDFGSFGESVIVRSGVRQWDFVRVYVGLEEATSARAPFTATLTVYGIRAAAKGRSERFVAGTDRVTIQPRPTPITTCLAVRAPGNVWEAQLSFDASEPEWFDDWTFGGATVAPPLPPDTQTPVVRITRPAPGERVTDPRILLSGTITDDRGPIGASHSVSWRSFGRTYLPATTTDNRTWRFLYTLADRLDKGSEYSITVYADDAAGHTGRASVTFIYDPPATQDVILSSYEITQGIQCLPTRAALADPAACRPNSLPMFANKPTLVRAYIRLVPGIGRREPSVQGRICRGTECVFSLNRITPLDVADPVADARDQLDETVNFMLPYAWTAPGTLDYVIEINPDGADGPEATLANNRFPYALRTVFREKRLDVVMTRIRIRGRSAARDDARAPARYMRMIYPASDLHIWTPSGDEATVVDVDDLTSRSGSGCGDDWNAVLDDLWWDNFYTDDPVDWLRYYGMVVESVPHGYHGCGYRPGDESAGMVRNADTHSADFAGEIFAQEIGHNHGRRHAPGCDAASRDPGYPSHTTDPDGNPAGDIGEWGIDLRAMRLIGPSSAFDFMGYCSPFWVGPYTYARLDRAIRRVDSLRAGVGYRLMTAVARPDYLVASVRIDGDRATLVKGFYRTPLPADFDPLPAGAGRYIAELRDRAGGILATQGFDIRDSGNAEAQASGVAEIVMPWRPGGASVLLRRESRQVLTVTASANAPTVQVTSPNGGESWPPGGKQAIEWNASDRDGNPLTYVVQFSPDGGSTWRALATGVRMTTHEVDTSDLAGTTDGLVRVIASDGFNTSWDTADAVFSIPTKKPSVWIASPFDGQRYANGRAAVFEAYGTDLEDGTIAGDAYIWRSNKQGTLGTGKTLFGVPLREGRHEIAVSVKDRDGNSVAQSVSIIVGDPGGFPMLPVVGAVVFSALVAAFVLLRRRRGTPNA